MDVAVGQTTERSLTVTGEQLRQYAEISGDHNPLHFDEECVAKTLFRGLMAHGGITTDLLHALVAMDMPGAETIFMDQH